MKTLNLHKQRQAHKIIVDNGEGEEKELLLPQEFTLGEEERIEEYEAKLKSTSQKEIDEDDEEMRKKMLDEYWDIVYHQILILFQHHQPEMTMEDLKTYLTRKEAGDIIKFFQENRFSKVAENISEEKATKLKKKPQKKD